MRDCISLEVAKELQEAGYTNECEYEYSTTQNGLNQSFHATLKSDHTNYNSPFYLTYPAPTATQLAEELPTRCPIHNEPLLIGPAFKDKEFCVGYGNHMELQGCHVEFGRFPDALGKIMVYLLKSKLI